MSQATGMGDHDLILIEKENPVEKNGIYFIIDQKCM